MKWTDLIIPGLVLYAVFKKTEQSPPQTITRTIPLQHINYNQGIQNIYPQKVVRPTYCESIGLTSEVLKRIIEESSREIGPVAFQVVLPKTISVETDNNTKEANKWLEIIKHPSEVVILGRRGSGKSCLAYRIAEYLKNVAPVYAVAFPDTAKKYLPDWIGVVPTLEELPENSIGIVDESYLLYHARSSMTETAKEMSRLINLSRQRNQTIIFVSQESGQIDRNILSGADVIIFKEPSMLQTRFERAELQSIADAANQAFQTVPGDRRRWSYVVAQGRQDIGLTESSPPTFWTNQLSRAFSYSGESTQHPAKRTTLLERIIEAKECRHQGESFRQIGKRLGISPATVKNYVDGYPYKKQY